MTEPDDDQRPSGGRGQAAAKRAGGRAARHGGRKLLLLLGVKGLAWALVFGLILLVVAAAAGAIGQAAAAPATGTGTAPDAAIGDGTWDAGNIIADAVFYNPAAITAEQIQSFLDDQGCLTTGCLGRASYSWPATSVAWCQPVAAGSGSFAVMLATVSTACGINPQVSLVMIAKESQGLTRSPVPAALTGFGCPDTGPGGAPNCDAGAGGVWAQTWGMVQAFARLKADPSRINYPPGQTSQVLWNVAETGCGSGPVLVQNTATGTLYTYTPYQPNDASLAAYPGVGDTCSSYGNRNFFRLFTKWFGSTGGGKPLAAAAGNVAVSGAAVTLPNNQYVAAALRGKTIQAPSAAMAHGLAAGFGALGLPYVWGGGGSGAGPNNGCARGGGDFNSCGSEIGFDCSGLTAYVLANAGVNGLAGDSGSQRGGGTAVPWAQGQPGDIVGFPGHVAIYLGVIDGTPYILEASWVGTPVHVVPLTRSDRDPVLHRYWR